MSRRTDEEIRAEEEARRPASYALGNPHPVERRPGWVVEYDRWFDEWVYTRVADGAVKRIMGGGTWADADIDLDIFEQEHPLPG